MTTILRSIDEWRSDPMFGQLVRFAVTGGLVTAIGAGLYGAIVALTPVHEQVAVFAAYVVCVAIGYVMHSRWSFRGHGSQAGAAVTTVRFVTVSLISYAMNAFFTWALVRGLELPRWTPVLPILFVTPLATFTLNRLWVFR